MVYCIIKIQFCFGFTPLPGALPLDPGTGSRSALAMSSPHCLEEIAATAAMDVFSTGVRLAYLLSPPNECILCVPSSKIVFGHAVSRHVSADEGGFHWTPSSRYGPCSGVFREGGNLTCPPQRWQTARPVAHVLLKYLSLGNLQNALKLKMFWVPVAYLWGMFSFGDTTEISVVFGVSKFYRSG